MTKKTTRVLKGLSPLRLSEHCRALETTYDRHAFELILSGGVFGDDGGDIDEVIADIAGVDSAGRKGER